MALDLFGEHGFHDTSMEQIADEAGVTKPVLYQHFSSKSTLYLELVETVGQALRDEIAVSAIAAGSPHLQVLAGFRAYFAFVCRQTSAFRLLFGSDARRFDEFSVAVREIEASLAGTIAAFIDAEIDEDHRALLGYAIVGLAEVAGRQWIERSLGGGELDPAAGEAMAQRLADLAWAGLRSLPGAEHRHDHETGNGL